MPFSQFPWFADATIRQIVDVTRPAKHHLHWPSLDVDLAVDSLEAPEEYPMVSQLTPSKVGRVAEPRRPRATRRR